MTGRIRSQFYFKVRNDISVATLTRIIRAMYELKDLEYDGVVYPVDGICTYAADILDMRIYVSYFENSREAMEILLESINKAVEMPRGALRIRERLV